MKIINLSLIALVLCVSTSMAQVKLPSFFSDNMVLQQSSKVALWGKAAPNQLVTITPSWNNTKYSVTAAKDSMWRVNIDTPAASYTPYNITITAKTKTSINNVLVGEVWLCSGQSNMEMPMYGFPGQPILGGQEAIVSSTNDALRCFTVKKVSTATKRDDVVGKWDMASPNTTGNFTATGYYFARLLQNTLNVPVAIIHSSWGGSSIEAWISKEAIANTAHDKNLPVTDKDIKAANQDATVLFNGMINPLAGYGIKGAIWYQGESNKDRYLEYPALFSAMHNDWIKRWDIGTFPIYFVQIAPFNYGPKSNSAFMRETQEKISKEQPNTGMAVLTDAGEVDCIHPANKQVVGERLAYIALAKSYSMSNLPHLSPTFKSMDVKNGKVFLTFENLNRGATTFGKEVANLFEIAGEDRKFHPAKVRVSLNNAPIEVWADNVPNPVAVRYAFSNTAHGTLYSAEGLPFSSFRTDTWDQ